MRGTGYSRDGSELMPLPLPAPPLQASAPGSAVDYPLTDLALDTNYTATVRGLRGPNFTSPASITFTTGMAREGCVWVTDDPREQIWASSLTLCICPIQG